MTLEETPGPERHQPLRLWPGIVLVALQWLARFVVPVFVPAFLPFGVMGGLALGLAVLVWWTFFSRATRLERFGGLTLIVLALAVTFPFLHPSIATTMMGMMFPIYAVPVLCLALVIWAVLQGKRPAAASRWSLAATILLACGFWLFLRTDGMTGDAKQDFNWRWAQTPEERLLALETEAPAGTRQAESAAAANRWPGFRGPRRDGIVRGVGIATDWSATPPRELWRRPVGPGVSSFAVAGDLFYTQEQRGEEEAVACYRLSTGEPVWRHGDEARFWDSHAGAGPRGTPSLYGGHVYALGATGILNALDALTGEPLWTQDAAAGNGAEIPGWGFASSPLVTEDLVIAALSGHLAAYDRHTGAPRWKAPKGGYGYSSPHLASLHGAEQVLLSRGSNIISVGLADGRLLWEHSLPSGTSIVQPALTANGDLLLSDGEGSGFRRISVIPASGSWTVEERWETNRLKPYFSDFVVHDGHAYGFDGSILASLDVETGERKWKGGRYGSGQMLLLEDQGLLLVLSEQGRLALVKASPEGYEELASFPALEGKTWNHPILVGETLLVRNAEEMAAFRLTTSGG